MTSTSVLLTITLWAFFGLQHSLFAQDISKNAFRKILGDVFVDHFYRFLYFLSQCLIYPITWHIVSSLESGKLLFTIPSWSFPFLLFIRLFSYSLIVISILAADANAFIGIKPLFNYLYGKLRHKAVNKTPVFGETRLVVFFPFNIIRHPMYLGILLSYLTSVSIVTDKFILNLFCLATYIGIGIYFEEKQLLKKFGPSYAQSRQQTSALFPLRWLTQNLNRLRHAYS